jgi:S23 ribosomal protein.
VRIPEELEVFRMADALVLEVYALAGRFPADERYALTSQVKRAVVSISSNIAEGCSRSSQKDFLRFLELALGSAFELAHQLSLSRRLGFVSAELCAPVEATVQRVSKMLVSLGKALRPSTQHPEPSHPRSP